MTDIFSTFCHAKNINFLHNLLSQVSFWNLEHFNPILGQEADNMNAISKPLGKILKTIWCQSSQNIASPNSAQFSGRCNKKKNTKNA